MKRLAAGLAVAAILGLLSGPVGTWLQGREAWVPSGAAVNAVYVVAGERDQDRRVGAAAAWVRNAERSGGRIDVLTGNERSVGPYSRPEQRNLNVGEWAVRKLAAADPALQGRVVIVPGRFNGTDGEMQALAAYLSARPEIRTLGLVTSPYHVRRVLIRLRAHLQRSVTLEAVVPSPVWTDRAPWTVAVELAKMVRDRLGLTHAPLLSRGKFLQNMGAGPASRAPSRR